MSLDISLTCPCCNNEIYSANITHNLTKMANVAGLYDCIWHPENINAKYAKDIIDPLKKGIDYMRENKTELEQYNPVNGWGNYNHLMGMAMDYLNACKRNPNALIEAWG